MEPYDLQKINALEENIAHLTKEQVLFNLFVPS